MKSELPVRFFIGCRRLDFFACAEFSESSPGLSYFTRMHCMKNQNDTDAAMAQERFSLKALVAAQSTVLILCRVALAFSWIYQGAVPKLYCMSSGEVELLGHIIPVYRWACIAVSWMGAGEILFGLYLLVARRKWVFWFNIVTLCTLLLFVGIFEPGMLSEPFNPLTLNVALIALSLIAILELNTSKRLF
jgi:hypothetical protein